MINNCVSTLKIIQSHGNFLRLIIICPLRIWDFEFKVIDKSAPHVLRPRNAHMRQYIIASDNGLSPGRRQVIIWTIAGILLNRPSRVNFNEILVEIHIFSFKEIHLKCRLQNDSHFVSASMCWYYNKHRGFIIANSAVDHETWEIYFKLKLVSNHVSLSSDSIYRKPFHD